MSINERCECQGSDIVCAKCKRTYPKSGNSFTRSVPKGTGQCKEYVKCPGCGEECCLEFDRPRPRLRP